jgi:hypothetical protein
MGIPHAPGQSFRLSRRYFLSSQVKGHKGKSRSQFEDPGPPKKLARRVSEKTSSRQLVNRGPSIFGPTKTARDRVPRSVCKLTGLRFEPYPHSSDTF